MDEQRLAFSSYHLKYDPEKHLAAWGARLLWDEIMEGSKGLVGDRQSALGEPELVKTIWPVIDQLVDDVRAVGQAYSLASSSKAVIERRDGNVFCVASPQGSYGYLYVTGVVER